jgi:hypothetical protein
MTRVLPSSAFLFGRSSAWVYPSQNALAPVPTLGNPVRAVGYAPARTSAPGFPLEVRVSYGGTGVVDPSHKLYVMLWDIADFAKEDSKLRPIDSRSITAKSGSVRFTKIKKNPVYISMVYDSRSGYAGNVPVPTEASIGLYSSEQGIPTPIPLKPGETTSVNARLDDSTTIKK